MMDIKRALLLCVLTLTGGTTLLAGDAYTFSQAKVTPDPSYARTEFASKWPHVSLAEAKRLHSLPGVVFVDGRGYSEFKMSHVTGALPLPVGEFDKRYPMIKAKLRKAKVLVLYCHGINCGLSETLAQLLADKGLRNMSVFAEGFPVWASAGLPLDDSPN